jgi:hypothetical protein
MIFNLVDMVGVGPEALGLGSEWSQIIMCQGDRKYLIDNSSKMASMKDSDDIYTVTIGEPGNNYTFEIDNKSYIEIPAGDLSDVPTMVYCIGNPIAINIFLQMEDMGFSFPTDKNTNLPYSIMLSVIDNTEVYIVFLGDVTQYGASNPDKIIASIKHIKQSTVHPIDGKFLVNAQAD